MDRTAEKSGGLMKIDDQIRKLQKISDMLKTAYDYINESEKETPWNPNSN